MKVKGMRRLLPILLLVFVLASALIYLFGDSGLVAYRNLESYRRSLAANVESLQKRNAGLSSELTSIRSDPDRLVVMARDVGLYRPGDKVVRLEGVPGRAAHYDVGDMLSMRKAADTRSATVKVVATSLAALLLAYALISERAFRRRPHGGKGR